MSRGRWEHFEHQADVGIRGYGATLEEAFAQAALALGAIITDPALVKPDIPVAIRCREEDPELLFVDWLNALIYEMSVRKMLFSRFELQIKHGRLEGSAWGEALVVERHHPAVEIKGATYTELRVHCDPDHCMAQCVVDV